MNLSARKNLEHVLISAGIIIGSFFGVRGLIHLHNCQEYEKENVAEVKAFNDDCYKHARPGFAQGLIYGALPLLYGLYRRETRKIDERS